MQNSTFNAPHSIGLCKSAVWSVNIFIFLDISITVFSSPQIWILVFFCYCFFKECKSLHSLMHWSSLVIVVFVSHSSEVIMGRMASQITSITTVYSIVCSGTNQRKYQSSVSLAFVRGIHRWPVNSPHKGPVTRIMFPFDDVIMR